MAQSLSFTDIVGQYARLTPVTGSHYSGHCPFCASADEDNLIVSLFSRRWICLSCGVEGDRYDFVSKAENISRANAILLIDQHSNTGLALPHARFKPGTAAKSGEPAPKAPKAAKAPAPAATNQPVTPQVSGENSLLTHFLEHRSDIPSYQGAAVLDDQSKMIACDNEYPLSANLAGIGEMLAPVLLHAGAAFSKWGMNTALPASLTLSSEDSAIVAHKSVSAGKGMLLVVQLASPADLPVARRLVASASAKTA